MQHVVPTLVAVSRWVNVDNTHILLKQSDEYLVPEWRIVGYTLLRQVYESRGPQWAVYVGAEKFPVTSFDDLNAARNYIELGA